MRYKLLGLFLVVLVGLSSPGRAQYENIWAFGTRCGIDFSSGKPQPVLTNMGVYPGTRYSAFGEGSASICDDRGRLLFYTEGFYVWDRNGNPMPNGRDLVPITSPNLENTPSSSTSQGVVIVPMPETPGKYYLFSLTARESWQQRAGDLYYSVVDMALNGGLGDVVPAQKSIYVDSFLSEKMTAAMGNRCNVWLLTSSINATSSNFRAYEVTADGVNTTAVVSATGLGSAMAPVGSLAVSPDRKKALATQTGIWGGNKGASLFDFDPNTGLFSNKVDLLACCAAYGAAFSRNSSKAYVASMNGKIYQYDLSTNNPTAIIESQFEVGSLNFSHLKLGPDGKIYFINGKQLGAINVPDSLGAACGYTANAVQMLPQQDMHGGLPNVVTVIPYGSEQSAQEAKAACWANVNQMSLSAKYATDGWDYSWNDGKTAAQRTVDTPGKYWVTYHTPPCNSHADTFYVYFPNGVLPDIHTGTTCKGASDGKAWASTYPGDTVTYHYEWRDSLGQVLSLTDSLKNIPSGPYALNVRTALCDTTLYFLVPEEEHKVSFDADSIICQETLLDFTNTSDEDFITFQWDFGDGSQSPQRSPEHVYPNSGTYRVMLKGIGKVCQDSIVKMIVVDSQFSGRFRLSSDSICLGQSISFLPQTDKSARGLRWLFGDGVDMVSGNEPEIRHAYEVPGVMPVQLTIQFRVCPEASYSDMVYVEPLPAIHLGPDTLICSRDRPVLLRNRLESAQPGDRYYWTTGDTTEQIQVVQPGTYGLTIRTAKLSCLATESVHVRKGCHTDIPNAFTPNGDDRNDYFFPRSLLTQDVSAFSLQVFNRFGQLIFTTTDINGRGWDGKFNGVEQPAGGYVYQVDIYFGQRPAERYKGSVTLMR